MSKPTLVLVGAALGAFGVRGEVRVRALTATPEGVCAYGALMDETGRAVMTPKRWRSIKDGLAITAPEVKTREDAEALRGTRLYVPRDRFPPPDEDEFYAVDLIGCAVEDVRGEAIGRVAALHDFGAGDILEIARDGAPLLVSFTKDAVPLVDLARRRIVVDPPPESEADESEDGR